MENSRFKFRAWDTYLNKMVYKFTLGSVTDIGHELWTCPTTLMNEGELTQRWVNNDCLEFMQYTGLKDKNCKEIYEGDICKVVNYASDYLRIEGKMYCVISWSNTAGFYGKGFGIPTTFAMGEEFEVIGNLYENPELLKEAK